MGKCKCDTYETAINSAIGVLQAALASSGGGDTGAERTNPPTPPPSAPPDNASAVWTVPAGCAVANNAALGRRGLDVLHPNTRLLAQRLLTECGKAGLRVLITETLRTAEQQDALFAQGRTTPGNIVTNLRGGQSAHNFGVAFDFCQNVRGQEFSDNNFFRTVGAIGKECGLFWGGDFRSFVDMPHFEDRSVGGGWTLASELVKRFGTLEAFQRTW